MGRGLSDLQKRILAVALSNVDAGIQVAATHNLREALRYTYLVGGEVGKKAREQIESQLAAGVEEQVVYHAHVYPREVLTAHWGFEPGYELSEREAKRGSSAYVFSPETVGRPQYSSAHAALSRAFRRLEQRGLVSWHPTGDWTPRPGWDLTEKGLEEARRLTGQDQG